MTRPSESRHQIASAMPRDGVLLLTAFASDDREGARLIAEIGRHAADSQWKGVDRTYKRLLEDHPGSLTGGAHLVAAQAARSQGDLLLALQRAQRVSADDELAGEATAIVERLSTTTRLVVLEARAANGAAASAPHRTGASRAAPPPPVRTRGPR